MLLFFPLDVSDEIWDVVESVSEGFLTYSCTQNVLRKSQANLLIYGNRLMAEIKIT